MPIPLILALFTIVGCDEDWAKKLETGTPIPDSRIEVKLKEPISKVDLYIKFKSIAIASDLVVYRGQPVTRESLTTPRQVYKFDSYPVDELATGYNLIFITYPVESTMPTSFVLILHNTRSMTNGAQEWLLFDKWHNQILPNAFPSAVVQTLRHPAAFTPRDERLNVQEQTGIVTPEEYR